MILTLVNNTATIKTYASGAVTLPASGSVTVPASLQLATAVDGNLFSDISQNNVEVSDSVNTFVINDGLVYLDRIVRIQTITNDASGTAITSTLLSSKQRLDVNLGSEGTDGSTAPVYSIQIGGKDGSGNLQTFLTDTSGRQSVNLNDGTGNAIKSTTNQDLQVDDSTRAAGLDAVITMTGAAIEVKVGASRLSTRKYVLMNPTGNSCKWGFTSTSQSFDVFKNGFTYFPAGPNTPIYIIGPSGVTVEIGEV